jgi:hypothetical protein
MEQVFSQGHLLLSYVHNHLSSESTCILLCLDDWSQLGLVKDANIKPTALLPNINSNEPSIVAGWDDIV